MAVAATIFTQELEFLRAREEFAFIGLPTKEAAKGLVPDVNEVLGKLGGLLGEVLKSTIEKRTAGEFESAREQFFPHYAQLMLALSRVALAIVPTDVLMRVTADSLCAMEADFREHALSAFGPSIQEQGMFTIWTLRKIADAGSRLTSLGKLDPELKQNDAEFSAMFAFHGLRARFHLDCLLASIHTGIPIYPDVLDQISTGLRSGVDAYAWLKRGLDLRVKLEDPVIDPIQLDDEDRLFLNASAFDMAAGPE